MEFIIDIRLRIHIVLLLCAVWAYFLDKRNKAPIRARGILPVITIFLGAISGNFLDFPKWLKAIFIIVILAQVGYYLKGRYDIKKGIIKPDNKILSGKLNVHQWLAFPVIFILVLIVEQLIILLIK